MIQATSCPSAPVLQQLLLGQSAEEESVSLEAHLLHCDKCLQTIKSLPPDDALISSLQEGRDFATQAPRSELLEKLRLRLQKMSASSRGGDTATAENTNPNAPFPSPELMADESVSLAPPQQPDEIGRLGGYRVLKELGRGGMGAVYQAEDPKLKRLVALKVMLPRLAADASARRRFLREAQAMAAVHHDHVVTIYQVDEDNGVPFLAMEFLHGTPLDQWLKDGRKPNLAQILRMGREIAEGLAAAHARGLIHRDIKPGNIWLDSDHKDRIKILDFGLARVGTEDLHLTRSGAIVGTPAYMSPEQGAGQKVDARTDLFSLGCILYRFCTGAMPFAGDTTMALLTALAVADPKPVCDLNPETPAALADLVMRLLAKKPADRPASAQEVAEQLEAIEKKPQGVVDQTEIVAPELQSSPLLAKPKSRRRTAVYALMGAAAALIVAAAGAVVYVQTDRGTLEIKTSDPEVKVSVQQNGADVDVLDPKSKQQLSIHSGIYTLKLTGVDGADHEMVIDQGTNPVTLTRGGKVVVTVRRVDKEKPAETAKSTFPPLDEAWAKKVRDLPAEKQVEEVAAELKRRNPGFDGKMTPSIWNNAVKVLVLKTNDVADLTPLRALAELEQLFCIGINGFKSRLADLSPLKDMKLTVLDCSYSLVSDLSPLKDMPLGNLNCTYSLVSDLSPVKGMPLTTLEFQNAKVSDLSPLRGMKLQRLVCAGTAVSDLSPLKGMKLVEFYCEGSPVSDLSPLKDMPLKTLFFNGTLVSDLSPLKDMKLTDLNCFGIRISDLSFLKNMPLKVLVCDVKPERDAEILRSIKTLETINGKPAAEFWKDVAGKSTFPPLDEAWIKLVASLPAAAQVEAVAAKLKERNPEFDGKVTPTVGGGMVTELVLSPDHVADLTPLRALPQLTSLRLFGAVAESRLSDLSTIKDLNLTRLDCTFTRVSDLSPLMGMPLTSLGCSNTRVSDLSPLKDMKLTALQCDHTRVSDLSPLKGMPLTHLACDRTLVFDLSPLKDMKLTWLNCYDTRVSDLSPLKDMPLTTLYLSGTLVSDLAPLKGMPLTFLVFGGTPVSDLSPLKDMKLTSLDCNGTPVSDLSPLKDMKLTDLNCAGTRVSDLSLLKNMPLNNLSCNFKVDRDAALLRSVKTLETINSKPAAEFWKDVASKPTFPPLDEAWAKKVRDLPAEKQVEEVAAELKRRNPGFDGVMTPSFQDNTVVELLLKTDDVADLTPLRALSGLKDLKFTGIDLTKCRLSDLSTIKDLKLTALICQFTRVSDLSPLKDMPLTKLGLYWAPVSDLSPLKNMKLTELVCYNALVSDLSPLKDMKLTVLNCGGTRVSDLSPLKDMKLTYLRCDATGVSDLSPLKGMPLTDLICDITQVSDLSPLRGMKLRSLHCGQTKVSDLSPLKGMPLKDLQCDFNPERDAEILRSIKTLETINGKPAAEFWKDVAGKPTFPPLDEAWAKKVHGLPAEKQVEEVAAELKRRNPGFDGKVTPTITNGVDVTGLAFLTDEVTDVTPVRVLTELEYLSFGEYDRNKGRLSDLSPLKGMKLTYLDCAGTRISDLSPLTDMPLTQLECNRAMVSDLLPLKDMKLTTLHCGGTRVSDLSPLKGMPLTELYCTATRISDLSPLKGMMLTRLDCSQTKVSDLSPLKGMSLVGFNCYFTAVSDLSPLKDMPLTNLRVEGSQVTDLSPLKGMKLTYLQWGANAIPDLSVLKNMPLKEIRGDFKPERDAEILRSIKTLETINDKPAAEFWKEVEAKAAEKKP